MFTSGGHIIENFLAVVLCNIYDVLWNLYKDQDQIQLAGST